MRTIWVVFLLAVVACACGVASEACATVLTMQGDVSNTNNVSPPPGPGYTYGPLGNGSTIVSEYGDNVAGPTQTDVPTIDFGAPPYWYNFTYGNNGEGYTPNVGVGKLVAYLSNNVLNTTTATRSWTAAGDRQLVAYPGAGTTNGGNWYWTFTADPGFNVKLISTDVVRFNSTVLPVTVSVYAGNTPLSLGPQLFTSGPLNVNNVAQTVSPNVSGASLTLEFAIAAGGASDEMFDFAADNIVFSQFVVPEPVSGALAGVALAGVAYAVRARRRTSS